jgi:hypothetical protein
MHMFRSSFTHSSKVILVLALVVLAAQLIAQQRAATVEFASDVQPILQRSCYSCHAGSDPQGQLHLDIRAMALKGGASGRPAIIPGNSRDSSLIQRIVGGAGVNKMPIVGTPLNPEQIDVLRNWIDQGAKWPDALAKHWAYEKPVRPALPSVL